MLHTELFLFLENELTAKLNQLRIFYPDHDEFLEKTNAMAVIFKQKNIMGITDERSVRALVSMLTTEEHADVRIEFLLQLTAKLKLQLGADGWNQLLDTIEGSLCITSQSMSQEKIAHYAMLGEINSSLLKINRDVLEANHWIVPLILFGLHNHAYVLVQEYIMELESMMSQSKRKGR